jgi:hypothetical protein
MRAESPLSTLTQERATARHALTQMQAAGSAARSVAVVADYAEGLVRHSYRWSVIKLKAMLLERALADLEDDDSHPLLDAAGRMLEGVTGGRYLPLRAPPGAARGKRRLPRLPGGSEGPRRRGLYEVSMAASWALPCEGPTSVSGAVRCASSPVVSMAS